MLTFETTAKVGEFIKDGPSLQKGAALFKENASAAAEVVKLSDEFGKAFHERDWKVARAIVARTSSCSSSPELCRLQTEVFRREQIALLRQYLSQFEGWALAEAPPPHLFWTTSYARMSPKKALPEAASLRLRVIYEVALREFRDSGFLRDVSQELVSLCASHRRKLAADQKKFCEALTIAGTGT
jgi:hypothetical protein